MATPFSIKLWQFMWFINIIDVLIDGVVRNYAGAIVSAFMAIFWAVIIQKYGEGEDILYIFFHNRRKLKKG